jgi:hypothetical protein
MHILMWEFEKIGFDNYRYFMPGVNGLGMQDQLLFHVAVLHWLQPLYIQSVASSNLVSPTNSGDIVDVFHLG